MIIPENILLEIRIRMESLITRRLGMLAENQLRAINELSPAYDGNAFAVLEDKFNEQYEKLIRLGDQ